MALLTKIAQGDTYRIRDEVTGTWLGRILLSAHADRLIRDADLCEALWAARGLSGGSRRTAFQAAINDWVTAGGRSVDMSGLTVSLSNDAGEQDGNLHLYVSGGWAGYLHAAGYNGNRLIRFCRMVEEVYAGSQQGTVALRQAAYDAALTRLSDDGGLTG